MPTIPTGKLERELRRLYMQWVHQLPNHQRDLHDYVAKFQRDSIALIERMGGDVARLGALADFPAPKRLDLSLHVGTIYSDMELAAISAQIGTGLNPTDTARALVRSGVDKSYRRLERLARTETVRAYWKNAWDSIDGLGLVMVWGSEDGPRTCAWCRERDGMVMDSPDLRDHPNGRCTPIPMLPSMVEYKGSVDASGRIYQDPAWSKGKLVEQTTPQDVYEFEEVTAKQALGLSRKHKDLTADQQMWTRKYQANGYSRLNRALRDNVSKARVIHEDFIRELDSVFTPLTQGVRVKRGQGFNAMLEALGIDPGDRDPEKWDIKGKIGAVLKQNGYYSASTNEKVAVSFLKNGGFLIDVEVPPGVGAHFLKTGDSLDKESELLLERGLMLTLTKADLIPDPRKGATGYVWRVTLRASKE